MADLARHAYGTTANLQQAISDGKIDAFDILFLDGDTEPKIGWVDKTGVPRICKPKVTQIVEGTALPEAGETGQIYIFNNEAYVYNGTEYIPLGQDVDVTELQNQIALKTDETKVQEMIDASFGIVEF